MHQYRFSSAEETRRRLEMTGYLADEGLATVVMLADRLAKPLLVEGPAGVGKTELAKALATALALPLVRLQCYEGVDEAKTLYEWNYKKQLLRIQAGTDETWTDLEEDIFSEPFLLERPVLKAIRSDEPVVLLIDEVDKLDIEAEALLLEVLSDWQITIPELGTISARRIPFVVLTSNNDRELSEALKRRCLFFYLDYPEPAREKEIVLARVPELPETLAAQVVTIVRSIRELELKKPPSVAETLDWATTLLHLNVSTLDDTTIARTLPVLIKFQSDLEKAGRHLKIAPDHSGN
ncbi:MAG TPA: MoxR family ATPase [Actinomycetota bacterium]|nr:MoxR family ATPase [Actinomycetota bacterium]